ncbi:MAG TPA: ATP-binding protein [Thermoanaerobaculia bacterium]|nr:ATP-binding protein [Thermoanaerobaculia bacterium]
MTAIRILSLEDSPFDAELIDRELRRGGIEVVLTRVDSEEGFRREVASGYYDVILADYNLPGFHGIAALEIAREVAPGIPFIFVSGSIGEERATQALREGATDYVLKDRLKRLPSAITRAIAEVEERRRRKEAEEALRQRERDLERARRVESLGRVAATIAHEFNNIMMGIQPFAEVIRRQSKDEKVLKAVEQIVASIARGRRVTQEILRFTKPTEPMLTEVVLEEWVRTMLPELRGLVGPKVQLDFEPASEPLTVRIDPVQMQQVLTNLVINAKDAMPDGGTIKVAVGQDAAYALLSVSDTGSGIPEHLLQTIFDPLFTTKRHGTGLGLAVTQQIVTVHGGTIDVWSAEGKGTTFTMRLPLSGGVQAEPRSNLPESGA